MIARRTKLVILTIALLLGAALYLYAGELGSISGIRSAKAIPTPSPTEDPMARILTHFGNAGAEIPAPVERQGESDVLPGAADFLAHQFVTPSPVPAPAQRAASAAPAPPGSGTGQESSSPLIDTLRDLQYRDTPIPFSQQIFGARVENTALPTVAPTGSPTITPTPTVTGTPPLERVGGMPTGYTMLYLMLPQARATVERQIQIMLDSQVNDLYLGVLADGNSEIDPPAKGTFGTDYAYLSSVVRRLNTDGRTLTLVIYFSNGSAMRNHDASTPDGIFNKVAPEWFIGYILNSTEIQTMFRQTVTKANQVFNLNRILNPKNSNFAIVMLEDNLTYDAYVTMRRIARAALDNRAEVMRNPCLGCYSKLQSNSDPVGSGLETHNPGDVGTLGKKDGFVIDGTGYAFSGEPPSSAFSLEQVKELKSKAIAGNIRYFGLWRAARQGLANTTTATPPKERTYEVPTDDQKVAEIDLLRFGLKPLSESSDRSSE